MKKHTKTFFFSWIEQASNATIGFGNGNITTDLRGNDLIQEIIKLISADGCKRTILSISEI